MSKTPRQEDRIDVSTEDGQAAQACAERLKTTGVSQSFIRNFMRMHALVAHGTTGIIPDQSIDPVSHIQKFEDLETVSVDTDSEKKILSQLVVCKLNGGLGTSMGLKRAKSLLCVRYDEKLKRRLSFNKLNARQISLLGSAIPLINMVSFNTAMDVKADLSEGELPASQLLYLNQNIHPKLLADTLMPATHQDDSLCWNPPGHGDFYESFYSSGMLETLLSQGRKYLFVSNADNLAASPDLSILKYVAQRQLPFLCEVTRRTAADRKGGHLARRRADGRLILREAAQAPTDDKAEISGDFQDIERHKCFNINSIWIDMEVLLQIMKDSDGFLPLALICNKKTLDPRDPYSAAVIQIETAIGSAIELFDRAELLEVTRDRFAPVKTTTDLLLILSDCFALNHQAALFPQVNPLPHLTLSPGYRMIDDFESLLQVVPSLKSARSFSISGNIRFSHAIRINGRVAIVDVRSNREKPYAIGAEHQSFSDVRVSISDQGMEIEPY